MKRDFACGFAARRVQRGSFGVECGDDVCLLSLRGCFFLLALQDALDELEDGAFAGFDCGDFGAWGEDA
ncbi:MAG TPA: hypothetical protein VNY74_14135 [Edaphobacter sp.]|nr:hypothetical protein [Edaphobacter sp.]